MFFSYRSLLRATEYNRQPVSFYQEKADGLRLLVGKEGTDISACTREGKTDLWPQLVDNGAEWVLLIKEIPSGTYLDCELHVPGIQATDIKTLVADNNCQLVLTPFALPFYCGRDWRQQHQQEVLSILAGMGFTPARTTWIHPSDMEAGSILKNQSVEKLKLKATESRLEGYVVKLGHYLNWYKIKPVRTVDCFVTKTTRSTSHSFGGGLKSITVAVFNSGNEQVIADVGCGFTADYRMSVDMKSLKGMVCEVSYDSLAGKGKLKFPRFIRWREDKSADQCTSEQLQ